MSKQPVVLIVDNPDDMTSVFTLGDVRIIEEDSYYSSRWADGEIEGSEREHVFALWERTAAELEDEWGPNDGASYLRECAAEGRRRVEARRRYDTRNTRPCTCEFPDPAIDPCGHSDTSEGCPRHDPQYDA